MRTEFWIESADDVEIYVRKWVNENKQPKAIVQLAHGMMEHIDRYDDFASYLVDNDIFVYGNDHRGHGKTGKKQGLVGYLSDQDGFAKTANDLYKVTKVIKKAYPATPLILFGHSMGSFLVRQYIQSHSDLIDGVILSGTGYFPTYVTKAGSLLARRLPPKEKSHMMNFLAFGLNNRKVNNKKTEFDWLTRDDKAVQTYIDDPRTGFIPTARFFYDLMEGLQTIHDSKLNQCIQKDLPMLLISGDADPVGDYAKGIWKTARLYEQIGMNHIKVMLFPEARHELLSELNKEEVYQAVDDWINLHM